MRTAAIILIFCHLSLIVNPVIALTQQQKQMTITVVKGSYLIGNGGIGHGISVGSVYEIHRGQIIVGRAEVKVVKRYLCGLKITEMNPTYRPRVGDKLVVQEGVGSETDNILSELQGSGFSRDALTGSNDREYAEENLEDFYYDGQATADDDYGSAFGGGFLAGILGGLIGWGIGYAIVSSKGATVPPRYMTRLNREERLQFSAGYKEKTKSKRKSSFNKGALTGTLIAVAIVIASYNSRY